MYRFRASAPATAARVQLLGSGAMLSEAMKAADMLEASTASPPTSGASPASASWRATASPPRRAAHGEADATQPMCSEQLAATRGPIVTATDYVRAVPEQIRAFLPRAATSRWAPTASAAATRAPRCARFFEVDAAAIIQAALRIIELPR